MTTKRAHPGPAILAGLLLFFLFAICHAGNRGLPPQEGIINFGKVNESLYRGAHPDSDGLKSLRRLGVKTIIDLRMPDKRLLAEAAEARADGIEYTNVPMRGTGQPAESQVSKVLALIETCPQPVFLHCEHGCDRTGTVIACYRMRHDQWSRDAALQEASFYGLSRFERGMKRYILAFSKRPPATKPALNPIAAAPSATVQQTAALTKP